MFAPPVAKAKTKTAGSSTANLALQRSTLVARSLGGGAVRQAHMLQRSVGNQAALRFLTQPSRSPTGSIQAKLVVGETSDPLEYEADRVADQVMRMSDPAVALTAAPPQISRKCDSCEAEEKLQRKPTASHGAAGEAPAIVHEVLRSPGQPLDSAARAFFEPRFGRSFRHIRVHTDDRAAESAQAIGARAYTLGSHIVFAGGRYQTGTPAGRHLLSHELAHTAQQERGAPARLQRAVCSDYNDKSKALCEQQKCVTSDGADGSCRKTGMNVCACFPARMWKEMLPSWVLVLLSAAALAAIAACFASGVCEFGAVVAGLGAAAAAAVIAVLKAAGIRDSGPSAAATPAPASDQGGSAAEETA